jgi:hypothetical protein
MRQILKIDENTGVMIENLYCVNFNKKDKLLGDNYLVQSKEFPRTQKLIYELELDYEEGDTLNVYVIGKAPTEVHVEAVSNYDSWARWMEKAIAFRVNENWVSGVKFVPALNDDAVIVYLHYTDSFGDFHEVTIIKKALTFALFEDKALLIQDINGQIIKLERLGFV